MLSRGRSLPVLLTDPVRRGPDRGTDRRITFGGLVVAIGFLAAALAAAALPPTVRRGTWLPLHLALAGGATTAIAAILPFFVAALAVAPPARPTLRLIGLAGVGGGALLVALGRATGLDGMAVAGGLGFVVGILGVGASAWSSLGSATRPRRPATERAYAVGLVNVAIGAAIATLFLGGGDAALAAWGSLKPAHAWLNLFGFVVVVIAGTLLHLAPTIAGSRIRRRPSGTLAVTALAVAAPTVALGYALRVDLLVQVGAGGAIVGAYALTAHGIAAHRDRAGWTTEREWHDFTGGSLLIAPAWLLVATLVAGARVVSAGADPSGWHLGDLVGPLVGGFVLQVVLGALSHLLPSIGPGTPDRHAAQRQRLGWAARPRLAWWNVGVGVLSVSTLADGSSGLSGGAGAVGVAAGAAMLAIGLGTTLVLLMVLLASGLRDRR